MSPPLLDNVLSPAKLNLFLHVIGRRPDGYHLLQSAFAAIDWFDVLHFERRNDGLITRHDLTITLPEQDLITRAAHVLQQTYNTSYGADISVEKNIPQQAGLGGGSSNAASTLIALNHLWDLHLSHGQLHALALQLGADVPFFLHNGPAWVEGIGEKISDLALPPATFAIPIAVVKPVHGVSTQQLFSSPLMTRNTKPAKICDFASFELFSDLYLNSNVNTITPEMQITTSLGNQIKSELNDKQVSGQNPYAVFDFGCNDLQAAAVASQPQIAQALQWLEKFSGGPARMTGSGSAVFAAMRKKTDIFDTLEPSTNLIPSGWQFKMCKILEIHPHSQWLPT